MGRLLKESYYRKERKKIMTTLIKERNTISVTPLQLEKIVLSNAAAMLKKARPILQNIQYTKEGTLQYTDSFQLVRIEKYADPADADILVNAMTGDVYDGDAVYPNLNKFVPDQTKEPAAFINVSEFLNLIEPLKAAIKKESKTKMQPVQFFFYTDKIVVRETEGKSDFISAELLTDTGIGGAFPDIDFKMDLGKLVPAFKLMKRLKIQTVDIYYTSSILPIYFMAGALTYLIMPMRTN